jgi:hypothetical protein
MSEPATILSEHLIACGAEPRALKAAALLGISPGQVLELILKYGPVFLDIVEEIAKATGKA